MRRASLWLPGSVALSLALMHYGDRALASLTGWPWDWAYAVCQSAGQVLLWALVATLGRGLAVLPVGAMCLLGAAESAQRVACLIGQLLDPIDIPAGVALCDARTGLRLEAWGLAGLAVCAALLGAWAARRAD